MELSQRLNLGDLGKLLDDTPNDTGKDSARKGDKDSDGSAFGRLAALIERVTGEEDSVGPDTRLKDAGVSSLDRIELAIRIEDEFGARITERVYDEYETVGQLADFLEEEQ